jgi:hypothetical protein
MVKSAKVVTVLEEEDFQKLADLSRRKGLSLSSIVRLAIKEFLDRERGE